MNHFLLLLFWIVYYTFHSIFASTPVKGFFEIKSGKFFRYYRLTYSILSTIALAFLLYFQYSFYSPILIKSTLIKNFSILFLVLPGMAIMFISIKKYFLLLSGIRSVYFAAPAAELKVNGIHRFVRHPLYTGTILFVTGLFFVFPTLSNLISVLSLILYVLIGIIFEEKKLVKEFGSDYLHYMEKVPKLIPSFQKQKSKESAKNNRSIFDQ